MNQEMVLSRIEKMIYLIRGKKVMLDCDLAKLYGVETKVLNQAVKRNNERFPEDFMFKLSWSEFNKMKDLNSSFTEQKYLPNAFSENGVAMLSSVLKSREAIQVNIAVMRIFTQMKSFMLMEQGLKNRMDQIERDGYSKTSC